MIINCSDEGKGKVKSSLYLTKYYAIKTTPWTRMGGWMYSSTYS